MQISPSIIENSNFFNNFFVMNSKVTKMAYTPILSWSRITINIFSTLLTIVQTYTLCTDNHHTLNEILFRESEILFRENEIVFRESEILFRESEILFRESEILFRENEIIFRESEIKIIHTRS